MTKVKRRMYLLYNKYMANVAYGPNGTFIGVPTPADGVSCTIPGLCLQCIGCGCQPDIAGTVKGGKCLTACQYCRANVDPKINYFVDPCQQTCSAINPINIKPLLKPLPVKTTYLPILVQNISNLWPFFLGGLGVMLIVKLLKQ